MTLFEQLCDVRCVGCRTWGTIACDRCLIEWTSEPRTRVLRAGIPLITLGEYRGGLRRMIIAAKHGGARSSVTRLVEPLRFAVGHLGDVVAIPIPSSRPGYLARGFGLAGVLARATGLPLRPCLALDDRGSQRGRQRTERHARTMRTRSSRPRVGTRAVIIDDVVTTGATVDAAIDACVAAGIVVVAVLALATATCSSTRPAPLSNISAKV